MAVANITSARDTVLGMLKTAWAAVSPSPGPLFYSDQDENAPVTYGVGSVQHGATPQQALGEQKRYATDARLVVDIFGEYGLGADALDPQIIAVQNAFRGTKSIPDSIWFRSVVTAERPRKGKSQCTRVVVNFQYDEIRA